MTTWEKPGSGNRGPGSGGGLRSRFHAGWSLALPGCCLLVLLAGCAASGGHKLSSTATAPFPEELPSAGQQKRTLPWTEQTEFAASRLELPLPFPESKPGGDSPGLIAAREWLSARAKSQAALRQRLEALPASEPPPGESRLLSLGDLAARQPSLNTTLETQVADAAETRTITADGGGRLELALPLKNLASEVLLQGGGFTPESPLGMSVQPKARAQADAEADARRTLTQKLLESEIGPGFRYYEWVRLSADRRALMEAAIAQAKLLKSEETTGADGKPAWQVELELDPKPLRDRAADDYRDWKKLRKTAP